MGRPSESTAKKLFALTGNRCAFPGCTARLVDPKENGANARICHIKGNRDGSARYDEHQSEEERQGLTNLVAMCANHSDKIDNLSMIETYSVEWLLDVKAKHEAQFLGDVVDDKSAEQFAQKAIDRIVEQTLIFSMNQSGGQTAKTIFNFHMNAELAEDAFNKELEARNLFDPSKPEFGKTSYSKRHVFVSLDNKAFALPSSGILFAILPKEIVMQPDKTRLLGWMDANKRRYEPAAYRNFIPTLVGSSVGRGFVWSDKEKYGSTGVYMTYLAVETGGYIEYGFYPGSVGDEKPCIYYARVMANVVAFLHFIRDISTAFEIDVNGAGIGLALCGTRSKQLEKIRDSLRDFRRYVTSGSQDELLWTRKPSDGGWTVDGLATEVAFEVLGHWGVDIPTWEELPEFEKEIYTGSLFKRYFNELGG